MKVTYICEVCGKTFKTEEGAAECERVHAEKAAKKKAMQEKQREREDEISRLVSEFFKEFKRLPEIKLDSGEGLTYVGAIDIIDRLFNGEIKI